jgi:hypothetical protein
VASTCREEVPAALESRAARQVFTVREVYAEMAAIGTGFAETTVFNAMQGMRTLCFGRRTLAWADGGRKFGASSV